MWRRYMRWYRRVAPAPSWVAALPMGALWVAALSVGACTDPPFEAPGPGCPNEVVVEGGDCTPGLRCNYAEPTACARYFTAVCSAEGVWTFERPCGDGGEAAGGDGASGGEGGGTGGVGGQECVDSKAGGPLVDSPLSLTLAPDAASGTYVLTFDEEVDDVSAHLVWSGAGSLDGVSPSGDNHLVRFSGLSPGDSATLTVDGVTDLCGNEMEAPAVVHIDVLSHCHLLEEAFEGDFLNNAWSTTDQGSDGHVWARNDQFDAPNGVDNHTDGLGMCASANGIDSESGDAWNAVLEAPAIDLTGTEHVALRFQSAFHDAGSAGAAQLEASSDGASWSPVKSWNTDHTGQQIVDLSAWAGGTVYLRWRYSNDGGVESWWDVDDVCVERFTNVSCACTPGGTTEMTDVAGVSDGNGTVLTAEPTAAVLSGVGDRVTVCGNMEPATSSGADFFRFSVAPGAGPLTARVRYCVENAFQPASSAVWLKGEPDPVVVADEVTNTGTYEVPLTDGLEHFVSLSPPDAAYNPSRYRMIVEVTSASTPILTESFEVWPPIAFSVTDDDPCADWQQASQTVVPAGTPPSDLNALAYFNSYDCSTGMEALETSPLNFVGLTSVMLQLDMFHDPGFPGAGDSIQIEYATASTWTPIGAPILRPGTTEEWDTHTVDLSSLAGLSSVRLRLLATSAYGNNIHIDNVRLLSN